MKNMMKDFEKNQFDMFMIIMIKKFQLDKKLWLQKLMNMMLLVIKILFLEKLKSEKKLNTNYNKNPIKYGIFIYLKRFSKT